MKQITDKITSILVKNGIDWRVMNPLINDIEGLVIEINSEMLKENLFTKEKMKEGSKCKVCNQFVKMYKKKIDSQMAYFLFKLNKLTKDNPLTPFFHVQDDINVTMKVGGAWAKLRYWELIEEMPKDSMTTEKRTSGMWRITDKGISFIEGNVSVPKYVKLYNQTFYGYEGDDVYIHDVIKEKFNYRELMSM